MSMPDLIIGGITIPRLSCLTYSQAYQGIRPSSLLRLGDGSGVIQAHGWAKLATTIKCTGWTSAGLAGLDWADPAGITIACAVPLSIQATSNAITIPSARRTDVAPWGYAIVGGRLVVTSVSMAGNVATLTTVSGAAAYKVDWLPLITCFCEGGPRPMYDSSGNAFGWELSGEQL